MITTIIFDADGVIVDSEPLYDIGQTEFLARRGFVYDREILKPLLSGRGLENMIERCREHYGFFPGEIEDLKQEFREIMMRQITEHIAYIPGFEQFMAKIKDSYKTGVATGSNPEFLKVYHNKLGLFDFFKDHIYSVSGLGLANKPNPDIFLYVAEKLGSKPGECVVIEDAPSGIEAARRAGMKSIGLAGTHTADHLTQADLVVESYKQINVDELRQL